MVATIRAALDAGIRLIDTARAYTTRDHPGHSEMVIGRVLAVHPASRETLVTTKGGHYRIGDEFPIDARRDTVRRHCELSLKLLGVECIELYQLHWPDQNISMTEAMKTFAELQDEGLIRHVGLSNVTIAQLEEAMSVVHVVSVENHFSPCDQRDRAMVDYCAERQIAYLSWSPIREVTASKFPKAAAFARGLSVSLQRLALAWLLSLSPTMIPICGASRPESIRDSARAPELPVTQAELMTLDFAQ
jgi:aryl-alcohol dehydrogenase-like predicted oxidoreductase